jgi:glyoxylase-like metal-dependent hydrolase (beta-lactamase superfamily II)
MASVEAIGSGVYQVGQPRVNSFIVVGHDRSVTLVDTGLPNRHQAITGALSDLGRSPADVTAILLTHAHADHIGGALELKRRSGAAIYASEAESAVIRGDKPPPPPPTIERST